MSKELKITIAGTTGSGKSSIAALITAVLAEAGIEVVLADPDVDMDGLVKYLGPPLMKRVEALKKEGFAITVETVQIHQESVNPHKQELH